MFDLTTHYGKKSFATYEDACKYLQNARKTTKIEFSDAFMPMGFKLVDGKLIKMEEAVIIPLNSRKKRPRIGQKQG